VEVANAESVDWQLTDDRGCLGRSVGIVALAGTVVALAGIVVARTAGALSTLSELASADVADLVAVVVRVVADGLSLRGSAPCGERSTSVDNEDLACRERRLLAAEVDKSVRDVTRCAYATHRDTFCGGGYASRPQGIDPIECLGSLDDSRGGSPCLVSARRVESGGQLDQAAFELDG